jgi:hypothetical protein
MVETQAVLLAPDESAALGRQARAAVPRSTHAELSVDADRPDPVVLLQSQAKSRVPELVPIRHGRMMSSPFAYFRGAALGMATDLAHTPVSGITVQACGDAHLLNFGLYASPERRLVFDVNDFDEAYVGAWTWDLRRLVASLALLCRQKVLPDQVIDALIGRAVRWPCPRSGSSAPGRRPSPARSGRCGAWRG